MRVYEYEITFKKEQTLHLPVGSQIINVKEIDMNLYLYVLEDVNNKTTKRAIEIYKSNQEIKSDNGVSRKYIGTFIRLDGHAYHIFEKVIN